MIRLFKAAAALLCVLGMYLPAQAQTGLTTITAAKISMGGVPISAGTVTFTPVNTMGIPIAFATGDGGGLNSPAAFSCSITAGAITGTCQVPDAALTSPANILYAIQISNTASQKAFTLQAVPNITGNTWALDAYGPSSTTTNAESISVAYGTAAPPASCVSPSFYVQNADGGLLYMCVAGSQVLVTGGGGGAVSAASMQAAVAGLTGCATAGNAWNPATNTCTAASSGSGVSVPSVTSLLKGNGSGGVIAAVSGTDYATPASVTSATSVAQAAAIAAAATPASVTAAIATAEAASDPVGSAATVQTNLNATNAIVSGHTATLAGLGTAATHAATDFATPASVTAAASAASTATAIADGALPLSGGTMTGPVVLVADPTVPTQAATKNYVDTKATLPSTAGVVCNTSTTASVNCPSSTIQTAIGTGVYTPAAAIDTAGLQALYLPYTMGSTGTTLTDLSGNGNNGTFAASPHTPTFTLDGGGLVFAENQNISIPDAALVGGKTVVIWLAPTSTGQQGQSVQVILGDSNNVFVGTVASLNGVVTQGTGAGPAIRTIDRNVGPSSIAFTIPATGTPQAFINGKPSITIVNALSPFTSATTALIGDDAAGPNTGYAWSGIIYGIAIYNVVKTDVPAIVQAGEALIQQHSGVRFADYQPPMWLINPGHSMDYNFGGSEFYETTPITMFAKAAGIDQWYNDGISAQLMSTIVTNLPTKEIPFSIGKNGMKILTCMMGCATNDISSGASAASIIASYQSFCSLWKAANRTQPCVVSTIMARGTYTSAMEAVRESVNSSIVGMQIAGTLGADAVNDLASNVTMNTTMVPNNYQPTGTPGCVNTFSIDCIHPDNTALPSMATQGGCTLLDAMKRMNKPCWIQQVIPWQALAKFANTSQVIPLQQLWNGWQVCGVRVNVTTPFASPSLTGLTVTVGDGGTGGSGTTYLSTPQSLLATGSVSVDPSAFGSPNFNSTHGLVNMTVTSVSGNMSTITGGAATVELCVQDIP